MKKRNVLALAVAAVLLLAALCGCGAQNDPTPESSTPAPRTPVKVSAIAGPTGIGLVDLMDKSDAGKSANDYTVTIVTDPQQAVAAIVNGSADIAAVPTNLASTLYKKTEGKVQVLAINTLGILYVVENGEQTVQSFEDLRGRTIYSSGKGATPEYALNYLLEGNGLDPEKDVTVEYKSEHAECLAALLSNEGSVAVLPQPFVTTAQMKQESVHVALDLTAEWAKLQEGSDEPSAMLTGIVIARTDYVAEHPEEVSKFLDGYKASVEYVNANVEDAAKLIAAFDIVPEAVAQKALPYCQIVFIEGAEMKEQLSVYLKVLFDQNPQSVGGALPDDAFYFQR